VTPDQIARLRELRKKAGAKGSTWSEVAEWMAAISNAAPDLLDAAERENQKHEGWTRCETHHSWMLLPDAECPSCKIAALESALAKERERAERWKACAVEYRKDHSCECGREENNDLCLKVCMTCDMARAVDAALAADAEKEEK